MKSIREFSEIYMHRLPVDGRKQINGLCVIVQNAMGMNPFSSVLYVFTTKKRDFVKILHWDKTGFVLWMKRLEEERFRWPLKMEGEVISLTVDQLSWLLDGYDIMRMKPHSILAYSAVS